MNLRPVKGVSLWRGGCFLGPCEGATAELFLAQGHEGGAPPSGFAGGATWMPGQVSSRLLPCVRCKMRGRQHSLTIRASASRAVQEPAALPIAVAGPASGWAFTARTHAKQRQVCASPDVLF
jgi:hypothetical protein